MPVSRDAWHPARTRRGFFARILRPVPPAYGGALAQQPSPRTTLVDAGTRTFWSRGSGAAATLVEADGVSRPQRPGRIAALLATHERGQSDEAPRANPAFTEALFVELMRARQFRRAFGMLADECRAEWGSEEAFASAQGQGPLDRLRGVKVLEVRHLDEWLDASRGKTYRGVAELEVEYTVEAGASSVAMARVVHLVSRGGRWWSLCYPGSSSDARCPAEQG